MAGDILRWLRAQRPELASFLEYWNIEPSKRRRESQGKRLGELAGDVRWFDSWSQLPATGVRGFIVTNELLDAMPVHRLGWDAGRKEWFEWGVTSVGEDFGWVRMPVTPDLRAGGMLPKMPGELLDVLPDGFTTEVGPLAVEWWREAANVLRSGKLIAFDYGLAAEQFFTPERRDGTLRAYHRHHQSNDLLAHVGKQDITAQVNFTAIQQAGENAGLRTESFLTQAQFLTGIVAKLSESGTFANQWTSGRARQFQTLTHPEHLGNSFRVLVQAR